MNHTGTERFRLAERATLSKPPREFASRMGWATFGASLGAYLGVAMSNQSGWSFPGWSLLLGAALVSLSSVAVVWIVWFPVRSTMHVGRQEGLASDGC